jgi:hypothetical protein
VEVSTADGRAAHVPHVPAAAHETTEPIVRGKGRESGERETSERKGKGTR